jgi:aromatic-L-amino-acid decarboxylase
LGRRFRALKLWWVLRYYGASGLRAMVRDHVALAGEFANRINQDDRFELFAPHPFGLVCFGRVEGNEATRKLADDLNASGRVAVTPSRINDQWFIRVSVGQTHTRSEHIEKLWQLIEQLSI